MKTVIFVNRYFYPDQSATSQLLTDLVFFLSSKGFKICVITGRHSYENDQSLPAMEIIDNVEIYRVWTTKFGRANLLGRSVDYLTFYVSAVWRMFALVKKHHCVVAKTDPPLISVAALLVCKLKGAKLINWTQDLFPEVGHELGIKLLGILKFPLVKIRNLALSRAYKNVVIGERMRDHIVHNGVDKKDIIVIPNWSKASDIRPVDPEKNTLRTQWDLQGKFIVGYSGNMGRAHEFETIIDIVASFRDDDGVLFLFIGGGAKRDWLEKIFKDRGLGNVMFKPYQDRSVLSLSLSLPDLHLISLYPGLEGLIVPSKYYGIASAGRPTLFIGDRDGEVARILTRHKSGFSVGIGDVQQAVDLIKSIKDDPAICKEYGKNARSFYISEYDYDVAMLKWNEIINYC